jgi:hypothetical protein
MIGIIGESTRGIGGWLLPWAGKPSERAFGSVIGVHEGHQAFGAHAMPSRRKRIEPTDWRFSMEQIGRELGKIYRQPKRLPQRLRAVVTQLEHKFPKRRGRQQSND